MNEKKVEIENTKEEILEIIEKCNFCGLCKQLDPVFRIIKEESQSPRGWVILFEKKVFNKDVFDYPLSGVCKESCPFNIDIDNAIRKARKILNLKGQENPVNKEILKKIKNKENPYKD
jgi:Fe-S oxidoreductase